MKYVIFGGGGFIGSHIADKLLSDGHSIKIFERPRVPYYRDFGGEENIEWIAGDIQSKHDIESAMEGADGVLHLVSTTLPKSSNDDPAFDVQTNVIGTINLLDSMVRLDIKKIVFISSGGTVYGTPKEIPISEIHSTEPETSYGITKLAIEKYLYLYSKLHGIQPVSLRVSNPFGERQRIETAQGAIAAFINNAIKGNAVEIWGDGSVTRDYIYVKDLAAAFTQALKYEGKHQIFNVGTGVGTSLLELLDIIEEITNKKIEKRFKPGRAFDVKENILDCNLARVELGWSARAELKESLRKTIDWYSK